MEYCIRALDSEVETAGFRCGEVALDEYLHRYARQDIKRGVARVFVASPAEQARVLAGFYTLSAASVAAEQLPEALRKKLPRYPVPAALLGRLAVSETAQGQGLGSILLVDACKRVAAASQTLAVAAIIVDAKSPAAAAFYRHFGFVELPGQPERWMLPRARFASLV
ncbi:GNAT family N-acetyltransferase [Thauera aromatica]|uniref:Putative acetyltransferase n=1 Tax=Thauera aromatica K172 TaxID=44139 RepID=A0A2R4BLX5_THAAR|nr:GNAT family N-acetyltransferase [Thauera aromatica]AVR88310.1 putative acetyltransferase [Thauera aromatica K172]